MDLTPSGEGVSFNQDIISTHTEPFKGNCKWIKLFLIFLCLI